MKIWETDQCDQHWYFEEYQKMNRVISRSTRKWIDLQLNRGHRTPKTTEDNDTRPIFSAFVNWHYTDAYDIRKTMIRLPKIPK